MLFLDTQLHSSKEYRDHRANLRRRGEEDDVERVVRLVTTSPPPPLHHSPSRRRVRLLSPVSSPQPDHRGAGPVQQQAVDAMTASLNSDLLQANIKLADLQESLRHSRGLVKQLRVFREVDARAAKTELTTATEELRTTKTALSEQAAALTAATEDRSLTAQRLNTTRQSLKRVTQELAATQLVLLGKSRQVPDCPYT